VIAERGQLMSRPFGSTTSPLNWVQLQVTCKF
jgi:hypothetical protein